MSKVAWVLCLFYPEAWLIFFQMLMSQKICFFQMSIFFLHNFGCSNISHVEYTIVMHSFGSLTELSSILPNTFSASMLQDIRSGCPIELGDKCMWTAVGRGDGLSWRNPGVREARWIPLSHILQLYDWVIILLSSHLIIHQLRRWILVARLCGDYDAVI